MLKPVLTAPHHHHAGSVTLRQRCLRDKLFRQLIIKQRERIGVVVRFHGRSVAELAAGNEPYGLDIAKVFLAEVCSGVFWLGRGYSRKFQRQGAARV